MSDLILLSNGCLIDSSTLYTYPKLKSGGFEIAGEIALENHSEEWFNSLNDSDITLINWLLLDHKRTETVKELKQKTPY